MTFFSFQFHHYRIRNDEMRMADLNIVLSFHGHSYSRENEMTRLYTVRGPYLVTAEMRNDAQEVEL